MTYTAAVMAAGRAASWHLALQARCFGFFSNSSHNGTILLENQQKSWCYWILDCGFLIFLDVFSGYSMIFVRRWINLMITSLEKIQDPLRSLQKLSSLPRFQVKAGLWSWLRFFILKVGGLETSKKNKSIQTLDLLWLFSSNFPCLNGRWFGGHQLDVALYNAVLGACVQSLDKGQGMDLIILGQKGSIIPSVI